MKKFKNIAVDASLKAGKYLIANRKKVRLLKEKRKGADFLTTADVEAEKIIVNELHKNFPEHGIISEEAGEIFKGDKYQWVIDPLDGTKHYLKGLPFFCVAVTLRTVKNAILAVVYIPLTKELFVSSKGEGTYRNNEICKVSKVNRISESIIYVEFPSPKFKVDWKKRDYEKAWRMYEKLTRKAFRTRAYGSGPIGLAYTAMGGFDAYVRFQPLSYEDVLGGELMVKEAGGKVTDQKGTPIKMKGHELHTRVVASNSKIHNELLDILKS